jgi:ribosomal protein L31E
VFPNKHAYREDTSYVTEFCSNNDIIYYHPLSGEVRFPGSPNVFTLCANCCGTVVSVSSDNSLDDGVFSFPLSKTVMCRFCVPVCTPSSHKEGDPIYPKKHFMSYGKHVTLKCGDYAPLWVPPSFMRTTDEYATRLYYAVSKEIMRKHYTPETVSVDANVTTNIWSRILNSGFYPMMVRLTSCAKHHDKLIETYEYDKHKNTEENLVVFALDKSVSISRKRHASVEALPPPKITSSSSMPQSPMFRSAVPPPPSPIKPLQMADPSTMPKLVMPFAVSSTQEGIVPSTSTSSTAAPKRPGRPRIITDRKEKNAADALYKLSMFGEP